MCAIARDRRDNAVGKVRSVELPLVGERPGIGYTHGKHDAAARPEGPAGWLVGDCGKLRTKGCLHAPQCCQQENVDLSMAALHDFFWVSGYIAH